MEPQYRQIQPRIEKFRESQDRYRVEPKQFRALDSVSLTSAFDPEEVMVCIIKALAIAWDRYNHLAGLRGSLTPVHEQAIVELVSQDFMERLKDGAFWEMLSSIDWDISAAVDIDEARIARGFLLSVSYLADAVIFYRWMQNQTQVGAIPLRLTENLNRSLNYLTMVFVPADSDLDIRQQYQKWLLQLCKQTHSYITENHILYDDLNFFVTKIIEEIEPKIGWISLHPELFEFRWSEKNLSADINIGAYHIVISVFTDKTATIRAFYRGPDSGYPETEKIDEIFPIYEITEEGASEAARDIYGLHLMYEDEQF